MEIRRINNSELQSFKRCKRKWMLEYHLKLEDKDKEQSSNLYIGNLVHAGLESYYTGGDIMEPIRREEIAWQAAWASMPNSNMPYEIDPSIEMAQIMLEGYLPWVEETGIDAGLEVVAVEEELETSLGIIRGREVVLHGRLDKRVRDSDGHLLVFDHKTVADFSILVNRRLRLNQQLMTYLILVKLAKGENVHGAALNMLRKVKRSARAKPPFYMRETVTFNTEQLRSHYKHMVADIENLLRLEDELIADPSLTNAAATPTVDQDCGWKCPFDAICCMFDDGSNIEGVLNNMFKTKEKR